MGERGAIIGLLLCVCFCVILPIIAAAVSAIVIGAKHQDTTCDENALIPLHTWLFVYGGAALATIPILIALVIFLATEHFKPMLGMIAVIIATQLFMLAWNIVGAISLFRDSMDCKDEAQPLWVMTLIVLILQWLTFIQTCSLSKVKYNR